MDKQTRINRVVEILKEKNGASIKELSNYLDVTEMTIRRDIKQLREGGIVKLISGAVILDAEVPAESSDEAYDLSVQRSKRISEKYRIGELAASLIKPNDIVYFDLGTTTSAIIPHVSKNMGITAVCCSMNALLEVRKKGIEDIILIGGRFRPDIQMFESHEGVEMMKRTRISKAFISAAGVNVKLGVTCVNGCEVDTKNAAMQSALEKILVADSTKFDVVKPAFFAMIEQFDAVVTDNGITQEWADQIREMGLRLYIT